MYIKQAKKAFELIKKQPYLIPIVMLLDLLFLVSYGFIRSFIVNKIAPFLESIIQLSGQITTDINAFLGCGANPMDAMTQNSAFISNIGTIIRLLLVFGLLLYLSWVLFQGANWFLANKFVNKKIKLVSYVNKFALVNIFWFVILGATLFGFLKYSFFGILTGTLPVGESQIVLMSTIVNSIIIYFGFISIALVDKLSFIKNIKQTFVIGVLQFPRIILTYLIIIIGLAIVNYVISSIMSLNYVLSILLGIILVLPLLTFARVYFLLIINKLRKK